MDAPTCGSRSYSALLMSLCCQSRRLRCCSRARHCCPPWCLQCVRHVGRGSSWKAASSMAALSSSRRRQWGAHPHACMHFSFSLCSTASQHLEQHCTPITGVLSRPCMLAAVRTTLPSRWMRPGSAARPPSSMVTASRCPGATHEDILEVLYTKEDLAARIQVVGRCAPGG